MKKADDKANISFTCAKTVVFYKDGPKILAYQSEESKSKKLHYYKTCPTNVKVIEYETYNNFNTIGYVILDYDSVLIAT